MHANLIDRLLIPIDIIKRLPKRLIRLFVHLFVVRFHTNIPVKSAIDYFGDLPFHLLDIVGFPEIYQWTISILKPKLRRLYPNEFEMFCKVFGNEKLGKNIWINDKATWGTKRYVHAYVGSNVIHFAGRIDRHILLHEMVHVSQYHAFGSAYLARAIRAQLHKDPYAYGRGPGLHKAMISGTHFLDFNFEQQAQIIEDYYLIMQMQKSIDPAVLQSYEHYFNQMRTSFDKANFLIF